MKQFIEKYRDKILGTLSGFDRLVFRAQPRRLNALKWDAERKLMVAKGMEEYFWQNQIPFTKFGDHAKEVSDRLKENFLKRLEKEKVPIEYLRDSNINKDKRAREIAAKRGVESGPICGFTAMEPCPTFEYIKSRIITRKRPCYVVYQYEMHPVWGFMYARMQTWFPFQMQVGINGREWLARQMDREKMGYRQEGNCFVWIEDFSRAQQLMEEQQKTDWAGKLQEVGQQMNPFHEEIFERFPTENYWTCYQSEWATDIVFREAEFLKRQKQIFVRHAMENFHCVDILHYFGRRVKKEVPQRFQGQLEFNLKQYEEGERVKFWMKGNSTKFYDKAYSEQGSVFRAAETTLNNVSGFRAYRAKEGGDPEDLKWRCLRKGIADLHRRAEICQGVNDRLVDSLASVDDSRRVEELIAAVQKPVRWERRRVRALEPFGKDRALLQAIMDGRFQSQDIRNRDLQAILYDEPAATPAEQRRRSAAISRKLRMLRAHGVIHKIAGRHLYRVALQAQPTLIAVMTAAQISVQEINALREQAA